MESINQKNRVRAIRQYLAGIAQPITQTQAHELLARALGLKSKHVLAQQTSPSLNNAPAGELMLASTVSCSVFGPPSVRDIGTYTENSFLLGSFSLDSLQGLVEDLGGDTNWETSEGLRVEALDLLETQGAPCFKVEFDNSRNGGDADQNYVYIPKQLVESLTDLSTLGAITAVFKHDRSHALAHVIYYESDQFYTREGRPFVDPSDYA
jgi:hypothetical protein